MIDERYSIFDELAHGASAEEKAVILELLKEGHVTNRASPAPITLARYLIAYIVSVAVFSLETLRLAVSWKQDRGSSRSTLFCSSSERNTSNLHLQKLIRSSDNTFDVLILESPLKNFERKLSDLTNVGPIWCRSLATDLGAIFRNLGHQKRLISAVLEVAKIRSVSSRTLSMTLVRLLRGMSISKYLASSDVSRIVFSLSGNACTSIIEQRLKGNVKTIHWLHGVGLGFKFESFSDLTLVNNQFDYQYYDQNSSGLSGRTMFFPDETRMIKAPKGMNEVRTLVLYSNLVHPSSEYFKAKGIEVERDLLRIISKELSETDLVIKPHPSALPLLGDRLGSYIQQLDEFGFRLLAETDEFDPESTLYVSTVSTSFIDLISTGKCVFMYDDLADRSSGFQEMVSKDLRFRDTKRFNDALKLLESPGRLSSALGSFVVQSQTDTFDYLMEAKNQPGSDL